MSDDNLKYPVGKYDHATRIELNQVEELIEIIDDFSEDLTELVIDLEDEDLDKTYREGGWTIRQVISHCADSHANAFMRFKLALTEENPTIKPYHQNGWAGLPDADEAPVELSLLMIDGVHGRWVWLMDSMYAWHCRHHLEHIKLALRN